ncbi:hypothetical protein EJS90_18080 [Klebsiella pneumoniae]|nr:hypothetical protein EJS90_18080 [Klebsiella pneumoniae]
MFAGKKSAQIREILISESAWEEMTCLFAPSLVRHHAGGGYVRTFCASAKPGGIPGASRGSGRTRYCLGPGAYRAL